MEKKEVPFVPGFLPTPLSPRENLHLLGTKCHNCGTILLGTREFCENCTSSDVEVIALGKKGKVWSYTIQRFPPPPPYKPATQYLPRPVAWVELPEGVKIISIISCLPEKMKIDLEVELLVEKEWEDEVGNDVLMYKFRPVR